MMLRKSQAKITTCILFLILYFISDVVEAGFSKNIASGRGESVIQTSDGGFLVTGTIHDPNLVFIDSFITKLNRFGNQVWRKRLKGPSNDTGGSTLMLRRVIEVSDGYVVAGSMVGGNGGVVLMKLDQPGSVVWIKSVPETAFPFEGSLAPTTNGGFVFSGNFAPDAAANFLLAINFSGAGEIIWKKKYNFKAKASSVISTDDGGFLLGAGPVGNETDTTKFALIRLNSTGGIRWKKILTISGTNTFGQVIELREGGFALVANNNEDRVHVIVFNTGGGVVWSKFYGESLGSKTSITQVADGGLVVGADYENGLVFKLDPAGNIVWTLGFGKSTTTFRDISISPTIDGGSVTTGWMLLDDHDYAFILKIDSTGVTATCGSFRNPVLPVAVSRFNIRTQPVRVEPANVEVATDTVQISTTVPKVKNVCP